VSVGSFDWSGRSVFVTGHTGFKGGWLTIWLDLLGADVHGFGLAPPTVPSLFESAGIGDLLTTEHRADVRDYARLEAAVRAVRPDVIVHLAAQSLVAKGFDDPVETWSVNVLGTVNVLDVAHRSGDVSAVLAVTTDKVYEDLDHESGYQEMDELGASDPYGASKVAAELVARSFATVAKAETTKGAVRTATARSGNVIGGGDWSTERLVPDCLRAFGEGKPIALRSPTAVRPWQHVLDPLGGYIRLIEELHGPDGDRYATAWNFGPDRAGELTAIELAEMAVAAWGAPASIDPEVKSTSIPETHTLRLDSAKARGELGWSPFWDTHTAINRTVEWHKEWMGGGPMLETCRRQICEFMSVAR